MTSSSPKSPPLLEKVKSSLQKSVKKANRIREDHGQMLNPSTRGGTGNLEATQRVRSSIDHERHSMSSDSASTRTGSLEKARSAPSGGREENNSKGADYLREGEKVREERVDMAREEAVRNGLQGRS